MVNITLLQVTILATCLLCSFYLLESSGASSKLVIKITPAGQGQAKLSQKNITITPGTTVVWQNLLDDKVNLQSMTDSNHTLGEIINSSFIFPGETHEQTLNEIGSFKYSGNNGFGSYYIRGYVNVVNMSKIEKPVENVTTPVVNMSKIEKPVENVTTPSQEDYPLIQEDNTSMLTFSDNDIGFSLSYPSDWTQDTSQSQYSTVVSFKSPDDKGRVDIRIFPRGDYKTIKEYGDKEFKQDNDETLLQYYRNSSTLLGGKPALRAIYLTTYNPSIYEKAFGYQSSTSKAMMVATMVPEKKSIFALAYFANGSDFSKYLPAVEEMVKSFKIGSKTPIIQEED